MNKKRRAAMDVDTPAEPSQNAQTEMGKTTESATSSPSTRGAREVVLVVEDDSEFREMVVQYLEQARFTVYEARSGSEAIEMLRKRKYDAVLTDFKLPVHDGLQVLAETNDRWPDSAVILMTGYGTIDLAVEAMKMGADDFVSKPFDMARLPNVIRSAIEKRLLRAENRDLKRSQADEYRISNVIGSTATMRKVLHQVESAAAESQNVLLVGEEGTGRTRLARTIHYNSARKEHQFVHVHCDTMTDSAICEDLFGVSSLRHGDERPFRPGRLLLADKGTLFLDRVEALSPAVHAKLDRFFALPILPRSGSGKHAKVDVRVIASTNRNLARLAKTGGFDRNMYKRLSQRTIQLPPLRDRREEIPGLLQHFLKRYAAECGSPEKTLSPQALRCVTEFQWPGNIGELKSVIERAAVLSGKRVEMELDDLPPAVRKQDPFSVIEGIYVPENGVDIGSAMKRIERRFVEQGLRAAGGNKRKAADLLGVSRSTFVSMLRRLGSQRNGE